MEMQPIPANNFDRSKPFYPLVVNYVVALHGFVELASRHAMKVATASVEAGAPQAGPTVLSIPGEAVTNERLQDFYRDPANRGVTPLIGRLELRSEVEDAAIAVDPDELAEELFENHYYLLPWTMRAAGMLLVSAWEVTKASSDQSPIWEFLRHCRNAAGHGGRFNLLHGEPRRTAAWRTLAVTTSLQGSPLFNGYAGKGLLSPGDPLRLLWDIEQASPHLKPDLSDYPDP